MQVYALLNSEALPKLQVVEVATLFQLPSFQITGLPGPEVAEAKERIRSAIEASGLEFPRKRVILNLSPASIRKKGTGLDLAMALSILTLSLPEKVINYLESFRIGAWGELGLDGKVKPVGQLTRVIDAAWAKNEDPQNNVSKNNFNNRGLTHLFISNDEYENALQSLQWVRKGRESNLGSNLGSNPDSNLSPSPMASLKHPPVLIPVSSLLEVWDILSERKLPLTQSLQSDLPHHAQAHLKMKDLQTVYESLIPLNPSLERVIGAAVAGRHHILLLGPRGSGKSHSLEWLIALQPHVSAYDRLQQKLLAELNPTAAHGLYNDQVECVPVRRVSTQVRPSALIGGATATTIRPGEFSLAHGGVLIADEFPEWAKDSREVFREPLERGKVMLTRTHGSVELPAQFILAANGNLCPCGGWPRHLSNQISKKSLPICKCSDIVQRSYLGRLSGPILDRIDLVTLVTSPPQASLTLGKSLSELKEKVIATRLVLFQSWGKTPGLLTGSEVETLMQDHPSWNQSLASLNITSLRSRHKLVRLALTLSAWDGQISPSVSHFIEASYYRCEHLLAETDPS